MPSQINSLNNCNEIVKKMSICMLLTNSGKREIIANYSAAKIFFVWMTITAGTESKHPTSLYNAV